MTSPVDLAILGAGPAGSALALRLARRGFRVVAVEQRAVPAPKLCGEFLSAEAVARLAELDLLAALSPQAAPAEIRTVRLTAPRAPEVVHRLEPASLGLSRLALDAALAGAAAAAGAEMRPRWRAIAVTRRDAVLAIRGVTASGAHDEIVARTVVGAFGKAERLGDPTRGAAAEGGGRFIAWKAHHTGASPRETVELHAFAGGYVGVGPIEGAGVNVCGIATRTAFERAGSSVAALAAAAARENPALAARLAGLERLEPDLTAAAMPFRRRSPTAGDLLLVGDAAAIIAPLCGDGIGMALSGAALAEPLLALHLEGRLSRAAMLAEYAGRWRRAFSRQLAIGSGLQRLLLAPAGAAWALRLGSIAPPLVGWLVRNTRDAALSAGAASCAQGGAGR